MPGDYAGREPAVFSASVPYIPRVPAEAPFLRREGIHFLTFTRKSGAGGPCRWGTDRFSVFRISGACGYEVPESSGSGVSEELLPFPKEK